MFTNRRQFIKTAGAGFIGFGVLPALGRPVQPWDRYDPSGFPRATPESQGVSSQSIRQFIDAANSHDTISWHSFMMLRHGHVIAEGWWRPYSSEYIHSL